MTSTKPPTTSSSSPISPFPFAAAPDIIRSHQKDAYFTGHLTNTLTDLHRRLLGARSAHALAPELRTAASLLYFALTTLPGNRTLGEEYCDLVQLEGQTGRLPSVRRRAAYVAGSILLPYLVSRSLPGLRQRLRRLLERRLDSLRRRDALKGADAGTKARETRLWEYILQHLPSLTSSAPFQALTLAVFYFSGTYYELSKRLLSLRYVFTRSVPDTPDRAGYEVLGVLLVVQLAVQGYLHVRSTLQASSSSSTTSRERAAAIEAAGASNVSLNHDNSYTANNDLLLPGGAGAAQATRVDIAATTHTPVGRTPKFELTDDKVMGYIKGQEQRKCTLCLEELKDPAATQCGHVFCWECIGDWVREKPECPLCRRDAMVQHILPLRVV
ncbi:peroxisome biogenesis factor 10 [Amphichorda felina]